MERGFHDDDPGLTALIDQQRSDMIERLRTAKALCITVLGDDEDFIHWTLYERSDGRAEEFVVYAAIRAIRDVMAATDLPLEAAFKVVARGIAQGVAE